MISIEVKCDEDAPKSCLIMSNGLFFTDYLLISLYTFQNNGANCKTYFSNTFLGNVL